MTRALLITNPAAARIDARAVTAVRETLRSGGWQVEVLATAGPRDARRFATESRDQGFDVVLAYGGDGTAMQVAAGLVGSEIPLGIVPGGTGNILARNLRLPRDPTRAARLILRGQPYAIDLGRVARADGEHYFAVCGGTGFDALVMARTEAAHKRRWKTIAYMASALAELPLARSRPHRITVDGTVHEMDAAMVMIANCGEIFPPYISITPNVRPNDGWFDVFAVQANGVIGGVAAFVSLLRGPTAANGRQRFWGTRGREVRVEGTDGHTGPVQLDGELVGKTPFEARLLPNALRVIVDPAAVPGGASSNG